MTETDRCPAAKPYGVIKEGGELEGCHETEEAAEAQRRAFYASEGDKSLKHLTLEIKTVTTDRGEFSAIAATYTIDRVKDEIQPGAFEKTIAAWKTSGRRIPVHWDHLGSAENVIGSIDPATMRETKDGLYVEGKLDIDSSDVAKEAWRSMKNNAVALSFGYLVTNGKKKGDVLELHEIDLFEITVTPAPVNPDTKFLSLKSASEAQAEVEESAEHKANVLVVEGKQLTVASDTDRCPVDKPWAVTEEGELVSCHASEDEAREAMQKALSGVPPADEKTLRRQTDDMRLEQARGGLKAQKAETVSEDDRIKALVKESLLEVLGDEVVQERLKSLLPQPELPRDEMLSEAVGIASDEEPNEAKSAPQDPLKKRTYDLALEIASGEKVRRHVELEPEPESEPLDEAELRRRSDEFRLEIARGN